MTESRFAKGLKSKLIGLICVIGVIGCQQPANAPHENPKQENPLSSKKVTLNSNSNYGPESSSNALQAAEILQLDQFTFTDTPKLNSDEVKAKLVSLWPDVVLEDVERDDPNRFQWRVMEDGVYVTRLTITAFDDVEDMKHSIKISCAMYSAPLELLQLKKHEIKGLDMAGSQMLNDGPAIGVRGPYLIHVGGQGGLRQLKEIASAVFEDN